MRYRNATFALIDGLRDILAVGQRMEVRGSRVTELRNRVIVLDRPGERCIVTPARNSNVFATIAETMWFLAGRNDLPFLARYLPRAYDFSDDGETWRGAYGPRLCDWSGVDQIEECLSLLRNELASRRAVMSIFDPALDFADSKDIPCNNWIHWLVRDDRLHMNVAVRSSDIIWGFSGINSFEWSVLHELMATWLGVEVGDVSFFVSSFHLYERHERRARAIVERFPGETCYEYGIGSPHFVTPRDDFRELVEEWFRLESRARSKPESIDSLLQCLPDPLIRHFLELIQLYNGHLAGWPLTEIDARLATLAESDLTTAAYEFFHRKAPLNPEQIPQPSIARYWHRCLSERAREQTSDIATFRQAVIRLHARKTAAYGSSWKRRGEQISILCNIARKVDRLEHAMAGGSVAQDEHSLDTAVDLMVYCLKYQAYLADIDRDIGESLFGTGSPDARRGYSDGLDGFNHLISQADLTPLANVKARPNDVAPTVLAAFLELEGCFEEGGAARPARSRFLAARRVTDASIALIGALRREAPHLYHRFVSEHLGEAADATR